MKYPEMVDALKKITYKGQKDFWNLKHVFVEEGGIILDLMVSIKIKDRTTGEKNKIHKHHVFQDDELKQMTETRLLRTVRDLLIFLESHEVEEQLVYDGVRVFDPHAELTGTDVEEEKKQYEKNLKGVKKQIINQFNRYQDRSRE